ncbi:MAG TPA: DNA repair protein RecN [Terriglobales bacterium]|nr:DNA repair protein RecN [Terriglobales bacterium]
MLREKARGRVLRELRVENYAVIDNVAVEFAPGLNLLTGETGAGKSILIDALALLLGEKSSSEMVRHGAEKAVVSAVFEAEGAAMKVLDANGIDGAEGEIILRREIAAGGKNRVFVNNQPATVAVLKQLAPHLAAVHAQMESLLAFDAAARLEMLDTFAGAETGLTEQAHQTWRGLRERIADLERDEQDRLRLVDLWSFQKKEIEQAKLTPAEDEHLEAEKRVLANSEKIYAAAMGAYDALYEGNAAAATSLRAAARHLEELSRYDAKFQEAQAAVESARLVVEDVGMTVRDYGERVEASPERLEKIEDRLALLDRLKRKYGATLTDVIAYGEEVARKLDEVENRDEVLKKLRQDLASAGADYLEAARALSRRRYQGARKLEKLVEAELEELAMKGRFKVEVSGSDEPENWSAAGFDRVSYLIATNPGEPFRPAEQIASGGELSRVMLALKVSVESGGTAAKKRERTLVFDEIDTGIGGRAAEAVGKKLRALARAHQVVCITHLPQIAAFADHHYLIEKREAGGRSRTTVRRLNDDDRREEIARMLSGARLTETSRKHAEAMLSRRS